MSCNSSFSVPNLPNQPTDCSFPRREFGKSKITYRSFQGQWFKQWKWLHYDSVRDVAYCHYCVSAINSGKMQLKGNVQDSTFLSGFCNWKDATRCFHKHELTVTHKAAVEYMVTLPATTSDIGDLLSSNYASQKQANRHMLKIIQNVRFLARQGLALQGDGDEKESNFMQLLQLRAIDDPNISTTLDKKSDKYTSPQIQNEVLKLLYLQVLRSISSDVQHAKYYSLMADEVSDVSNKEQFVVCIRWIDDDLHAHEDFVGIHHVDTIEANTLVERLKDTLLRMNLSIHDCRGQSYDGASNMRGARNGVSTQILAEEPRATFMHCYGHALNLATADVVRNVKCLKNTLDTTLEVSKLLKYSPRRGGIFEKIKSEIAPETPGFRTLCPTRWTVRAASLASVKDNYQVLQELWDEALDVAKDSDTRARIIGVQHSMTTFEYFFGLLLGERILKHTDNLSKTLQNPSLSASDSQEIAELTCTTLASIRNDESFDLFWENVLLQQNHMGINEPALPRKRKAPARLEVGTGDSHYPLTPKDLYRQQYFQCLDLIVGFIKDRFNQPDYNTLKQVENVLIKSARKEDYHVQLEFLLKHYSDDFNPLLLGTQLELLATAMTSVNKPTLHDVLDYVRSLSPGQRTSMSQVCVLLTLILVMPATNAVSERSASSLRRIKTYLCSTMSQQRLNNLMILHTHKERTDALDLTQCLKDFTLGSDHRTDLFGRF